jgi:ribosomal protein S18 acetylase RimI-like enzyme
MTITVRPAAESDLPFLTRLDLTYPTDRYLKLERSGEAPEHTFRFQWRSRAPAAMAVYATYSRDQLRVALARADLFLVAEMDTETVGLLIASVPSWTDAAEITDLAVDIACRRAGARRALVEAAAQWAREDGYRALWAEPRADNFEAISFYTALGFPVSGFNDRMYSNVDDEDGRATIYMHLEL